MFKDDEVSISNISFFRLNKWNSSLQYSSNISEFSEKSELEEWLLVEKKQYLKMLKDRISYLKGLKEIQPNWINGQSVVPTEEALENGEHFIDAFSKYVKQETKYVKQETGYVKQENMVLPKILMGPIPEGGVCIELHASVENAMFAIFRNNGGIEVDIKQNNFYYSIDKLIDSTKLVEKYEQLTEY